jgi:hydrogenase maturation protease
VIRHDRFIHAEKLARALLYEGYLLYPYRRSSLKNRYRFPFGTLYPRAFCEVDSDRWWCETVGLAEATDAHTQIEVRLRFLQLASIEDAGDADAETVIEREVAVAPMLLARLLEQPLTQAFSFTSGGSTVEGELQLSASPCEAGVVQVSARLINVSTYDNRERDLVLQRSLLSAHTLFGLEGGAFISACDPPAHLAQLARSAASQGVWPVLVGPAGARDVLLSSPIVVSDYPQIAPESPGDLFDSTEMDEILSLRILTLTDDEKRELAAADPRARALLARTEALSAARLSSLHGTFRGSDGVVDPPQPAAPSEVLVGAAVLRVGDKVRLKPGPDADAFDLLLRDKIATIHSLEQDFEDQIYLTVTIDEDPGRDLADHGHRFFFRPTEVEPFKARRVLVAGVGNIFFGDDAFGVHVARRLADRVLPQGVEVVDFGIRGRDLGYALLDGYDAVILVDAVQRGGTPGTLYVIEPEGSDAGFMEGHDCRPDEVLGWVKAMGGQLGWVRLVGCEPENCAAGPEEEQDPSTLRGELSDAVREAVGPAVELVESLLNGALGEELHA